MSQGWLEILTSDAPLADAVEAVFRGPVAAAGLDVREGQIRMARAVADTIDSERSGAPETLAVEAATGAGKGQGYLVPSVLAILRNRLKGRKGSKVIVSTANIALQRQLVTKDVPMLAKLLNIGISVATMKGRNNYVCHEKLDTSLRTIGDGHAFAKRIRAWLDQGGSGDKEDLPGVASPKEWGAVSVSAEECLGQECLFARDCVSNRRRYEAEKAAVIVVNHSLLALAHQKLRTDAVALVADEAHELEDAIRGARGSYIHESSGGHWRKAIEKTNGSPEIGVAVESSIRNLVAIAARELGQETARRVLPGWCPEEAADVVRNAFAAGAEHFVAVARATAAAAESATSEEEEKALHRKSIRAEKAGEQFARLGRRIVAIAEGGDGHCAWVERDERRGVSLQIAPVDVACPPGFPAVILASATLAVGGRTTPAAESLGLENPAELVIPSPWPVERMAVAIVPRNAPDVTEAKWDPWAASTVVDFVHECGGGVLVLATSHKRARMFADGLRGAGLPWNVRVQGEAGRGELIRWMAEDRDGILVGTRSLFQGVDIQGDALRGVVIDRVPFPSPADPMEQAIGERIESEGGNAFRQRSLGVACALLRQAAGRLLRSSTDRGAVLLLDRRVTSSRYSRLLLGALSPMALSGDVADAGRILRGEPLQGISGTTIVRVPDQPAAAPVLRRPGQGIAVDLPFPNSPANPATGADS